MNGMWVWHVGVTYSGHRDVEGGFEGEHYSSQQHHKHCNGCILSISQLELLEYESGFDILKRMLCQLLVSRFCREQPSVRPRERERENLLVTVLWIHLNVWNKRESAACKLCGDDQSLIHVLNICKVARDERRFNGRHDAVLSEIVSQVVAKQLVQKDDQQAMLQDLQGP